MPSVVESEYWKNFQFTDGLGHANKTYVNLVTYYSGLLPSQYTNKFTLNAPVYRIVSNAKNLASSGISGGIFIARDKGPNLHNGSRCP